MLSIHNSHVIRRFFVAPHLQTIADLKAAIVAQFGLLQVSFLVLSLAFEWSLPFFFTPSGQIASPPDYLEYF